MSAENVQTPIIEKRVLKFLACETQENLMGSKGKYKKHIHVEDQLNQDGNEKQKSLKTAALFGEFVFDNGENTGDDRLRDEEFYVYFAYYLQNNIVKKLENE